MFDYVKDTGLAPKGAYTKRKKTERILLHHTSGGQGGVQKVRDIHAYHVSRGHKGIDYNIVVDTNGDVWWGRGLEYCGGSVNNTNAKTKGYNDTSIAIVAIGDFETYKMPEAQLKALLVLVRDVADYYGIKTILGHDEAAGPGYTDCPGKYFPLAEVKAYALHREAAEPQQEQAKTPEAQPSKPALTRNLKVASPMMRGDDVKHAQKQLDKNGIDVGGIDGVYGPKTKAGVIKFQQAKVKEGHDLGTSGAQKNGVDGVVGKKTWALL